MNHRFPSGPAVMPRGSLLLVGTENTVIAPPVMIRPILFPLNSVNHRAPPGPALRRAVR
jgi:hypothetical protein